MATDKDTFKMNTMQKNKLIAEFMGFELNDKDQYYVPNLGSFEDYLLQFHNNWNWLMKVVEKIETLFNNGIDIDIFTDGTVITQYRFSDKGKLQQGKELVRLTNAEIDFENNI